MTPCETCESLKCIDKEDGMVYRCEKTGKRYFINDLPMWCQFDEVEDNDG